MIPELTTEGPHLMQLLGLGKFHISQKSHQANIRLTLKDPGFLVFRIPGGGGGGGAVTALF